MAKKILFVNTVLNTASTGRIVEFLGRAAQDAGWEAFAAYGRGSPNGSRLTPVKVGAKASLYRNALSCRIFDNDGFCATKDTRALVSRIDEIRPDIVHLHNLHGYYLNISELLGHLAKKGIPAVMTLHDCWAFTGHCAYFDSARCEKWMRECGECPLKRAYPASMLLDRSRENHAEKIRLFSSLERFRFVPVSQWLSDLLAGSRLGGIGQTLIRNGINTGIFSERPPAPGSAAAKIAEKGPFIIGVANVWTRAKGLFDFAEIAARNPGLRIVLVGLSDRQARGLPGNIEVVSHTESREELAALYSAAAAFVNPTHADNYPTTNLEAISCGTPAVTYETGGSPESVLPGCGFSVKCGDIAGLCEKISLILASGRGAFRNACLKAAAENFSERLCAEKYLRLYGEVAGM